jgi:hypothetical protein
MCHLRLDRLQFETRQSGGAQRVESFLVGRARFLSVSDDFPLIVGLQGELAQGDGSFQIGLNQPNLKRVLLLCRLEFRDHRSGILAHRADLEHFIQNQRRHLYVWCRAGQFV